MTEKVFELQIQLFAADRQDDEQPRQAVRTEEGIELTDKDSTTKVDEDKRKSKKVKNDKVVVGLANNASIAEGKRGVSSQDSGSTPGMTAFRVGSYSGGDGRAQVGDSSSVQHVEGKHDPEGRFRKKVDEPVRRINDIVSEQITVDFDTVESLHKDADNTEGYRGRIIHDNTIVQKTKGTQVAEKSMFRSVDEVLRDEIYYSSGQNIFIEGYDYLKAPVNHIKLDNGKMTEVPSTEFTNGTIRPNGLNRSNYIPKELEIKLTKTNGKVVVTNFKFTTDVFDATLEATDMETANISAVHSRIHGNYSELKRQEMEDKAGNERDENWNPLARAINEPTATIGLMKDMEDDIGNVILSAHRKTAEALSYQLNRASKDGLHEMRPIVEAMVGLSNPEYNSDDFNEIDPFSATEVKKGSAATIIKMFDTTQKYDSKGIFLNLKRKSFANALSIAEANASNFKASDMFVKTLNQQQVFSTINKEYDPTSPVYISDNYRLVHPYDFNDFINIVGATKNYRPEERDFGIGIGYKAPNNSYYTMVDHPLIGGIYDWVVNFRNSLYSTGFDNRKDADSNGSVTIHVPIIYSTTKLSLWALIVLHATPFINRARIASFRELLDYENQNGYIFEDRSSTLKTLWNTSPKNYSFKGIDFPLEVRRMSQEVAQTWLMPELFIPYDEAGSSKFRYIAPFYMNEQNVEWNQDGSWRHDNFKPNYSFPIIRPGVRLESLDNMANMTPRKLRLSYDMITRPPVTEGNDGTGYVYKYDVTTDGVFAFDDLSGLVYDSILGLPRQLGLHFVAPYGYNSFVLDENRVGRYLNTLHPFKGQTSYRIKTYYSSAGVPVDFYEGSNAAIEAVNNPVAGVHSLGANLRQSWKMNHAGDIIQGTIVNGLQLALNSSFTTVGSTGEGTVQFVDGVSKVVPFIKGNGNKFGSVGPYFLLNMSNPIHFRLNYVPFLVSPWDAMPKPPRTGEEGIEMDPYSFMHMFNFVGFNAVDYQEETDIRIEKIQNESNFFVSDKWLEDKFNE